MKTPKDYLAEMQMDDDILFNRHEVSVWLSDFIKEIQKDAYNQAIEDAVNNSKVIEKCEYNKVHQENYFEYVVDQNSILKLKIK